MSRRASEKPKRPLSEAELAQRRAAAPKALAAGALAGKATGPVTEQGKAICSRNAWKHGMASAINRQQFGLGAASVSKLFGKPCLSTCPLHPDNPDRTESPCSLVLDGLTHAGGSCLDKTVYVNALQSMMAVMQDGEMDGMQGLLATELAANLQIVNQIRQEIATRGVMIPEYVLSREGQVVLDPRTGDPLVNGYNLNPAMSILAKFTEAHGVSFAELLATPRARQRLQDEDEAANALHTVLGAIVQRARPNRPAIEHGD